MNLLEMSGLGGGFLLGNHGCCGVPGIKDHSREGLERSWELGRGSLIDLVLGRGDKVLMSHEADIHLAKDDVVLFEDAVSWAEDKQVLLFLNLLQSGNAGKECAAGAVSLAVPRGLAFAFCSADGPFLRQIKKDLGGVATVYIGGGYADSFERDLLLEATKARCNGIIVDCDAPDYGWVEELFQKNEKRKKNRLVFLAHIGSEFECAPWCAAHGMGFICDDPLEAINAIMQCEY